MRFRDRLSVLSQRLPALAGECQGVMYVVHAESPMEPDVLRQGLAALVEDITKPSERESHSCIKRQDKTDSIWVESSICSQHNQDRPA